MGSRFLHFRDECFYFLPEQIINGEFYFPWKRQRIMNFCCRIKRIWIVLFEFKFERYIFIFCVGNDRGVGYHFFCIEKKRLIATPTTPIDVTLRGESFSIILDELHFYFTRLAVRAACQRIRYGRPLPGA